jgi:5-aminolevulinate synthase
VHSVGLYGPVGASNAARACSPATAAIHHLKTSEWECNRHQERAAQVKAALNVAGLPVMSNETHILPVMVGNPEKYKEAGDLLLIEHGILHPADQLSDRLARAERLRITPTPHHDDVLIDALAEALVDVWGLLGLPLPYRALAAERPPSHGSIAASRRL